VSGSTRRVAAIVGIGHTNYVQDYADVRAGKVRTDSNGYAVEAFIAALADADLTRDDIDGLIVGAPIVYERAGEILGLNVRWGDSADAVSAIAKAVMAIETGAAEVVALIYGNNQRSAGTQYGGPQAMGGDAFLSYVYHNPWGLTSQGALYGLLYQKYITERGYDPLMLGHVAVAERHWASLNPDALMRKPITHEDYAQAQFICQPLRLLDYCLVNDGGVALILTSAERARRSPQQPVFIDGIGRFDLNVGATSLEPRVDGFYQAAQQKAGEASYDMAGYGPQDMDVFSVYDSFSVHVPLAFEGYGYCAPGEVEKLFAEQGIGPGGKIPTNTGGGHLSESYMQGWGHQIELVRQLRGQAGARQVAAAKRGHYTSDVAGKAFSIVYSSEQGT
jgi:acetyl-CoA acetyltransferase